MVRAAKQSGVERASLTTNGTRSAEHLLSLVDAGLDEVRVSIDADEPTLGATLTGREGAWRKSLQTLRGLGAARRRGVPFFLIVNTVVGPSNRARVPQLVEQFLALGVDDLKLITDVDTRGFLADFPDANAVRAQLDALLAAHPPEAFPLLRRKVRTVFAPDAIGLAPTVGPDWRCFIPLTERTVDREFYYPCSVYLREGGAPLGRTTDDPLTQRARSAHFTATHTCASDPICQRYCLHCTRAYNDAVHASRGGGRVKLEVAAPDASAIASLGHWLERFDERLRGRAPVEARTPLVVTPLGLRDTSRLRVELQSMGLSPAAPVSLHPWPRLSTALQVRARTEAALRRALLFEAGWSCLAPDGRAEVWWLSTADAAQLVTAKHLLRSRFQTLAVDLGGHLARPVKLHAFHLPDADDFLSSALRLEVALEVMG
jgi:hypothetical protein